jgi:hypothetical protein
LGKIPYNFFLAKEFDDVHYLFTETHQLIWRRIFFFFACMHIGTVESNGEGDQALTTET